MEHHDKKKYVCIHGHLYQPPRENAWLEYVELQDSAAPYHDWNERVNFECYAPNTAARILDDDKYIIKILNNYTRMSFNFGPTLLSWMEKADPETYQSIIEADKISRERFGGHGSALAQVYSHLIMPLANRQDKITQVKWAIRDFEYRFGRLPEGMWLAETAVDTETLEILAEQDIKFTILAPRQAKAFRRIGDKDWQQLPHDSVDSRRPYLCRLPSGKSIVLFFYNGGVAQGVAFNGLLNNGKAFAHALLGAFSDNGDEQQIVHIATDGESYGHHHHHGEMALADCLNYIEEKELANLTNYGQFLELSPPTYEIQIYENSSWSCVHGIERWRANCGCNSGGHPGWNQEWRKPLRETLDWLRDQLIPIYSKQAAKLLHNVWEARNDYISVILNRHPENIEAFIHRHARRPLEREEKTQLLRLMELQRNSMLMFTSCGWFFDEISGLETNQILQYANRAIYYAQQVAGVDLHPEFIQRLEHAPSNMFENGAISYLKHVAPARLDLNRVAMHYAVSSIFEAFPEQLELFNYLADSEIFFRHEAGIYRLVVGRTVVRSRITLSEKMFSFAALYLGQANILGNISLDMDRQTFDEMAASLTAAFKETNLGEVIGLMQQYFGPGKYSITHLFRDEKQKILRQITEQNQHKVEASFREIYNDTYMLMSGMLKSSLPIPDAYLTAVKFVLNHDLYQFFSNGSLDNIRELKRIAGEFEKWKIEFSNQQGLKYVVSERLYQEIRDLADNDFPIQRLTNLNTIIDNLKAMHLELDEWKSQNLYFSILGKLHRGELIITDDQTRQLFYQLGDLLKVRYQVVESPVSS